MKTTKKSEVDGAGVVVRRINGKRERGNSEIE